ncbi:MAG: DUF2892 domain-containing protein [Chlorobium sp.]|nr:MAG: DUF2892 domain-containing protein [Chlorobium sp.]
MKKNMGKTDRIIRAIIGMVVLALGVVYHNWWGAIGLIPFITALIGFCPLYTIFGIKTCGSC